MLKKLESPHREICIRVCMILVVMSILIGIRVFLEQNKMLLQEFCKTVKNLCKALVLMCQHIAEAVINLVAALAAVVALCVIGCKFILVWSCLVLLTGSISGSSWKLWTTGFIYAANAVNMFVLVVKRTTGVDIYEKFYYLVFQDRVRQSWLHSKDMSKFFENPEKEKAERPPHPMDGFDC